MFVVRRPCWVYLSFIVSNSYEKKTYMHYAHLGITLGGHINNILWYHILIFVIR